MNIHAIPYIIPLIISTFVSLSLLYLLRKDRSLVALLFSGVHFCAMLWTSNYAMELLSEGISTTLLFSQLKFVGIALMPGVSFLFQPGIYG